MKPMNLAEFTALYCAKQEQHTQGLIDRLKKQREQFNPDGWMLLECHQLDSSRVGQLTILPYGPNNTFKTVPDHPISPRGLASDMSVVIGTLEAKELEAQ